MLWTIYKLHEYAIMQCEWKGLVYITRQISHKYKLSFCPFRHVIQVCNCELVIFISFSVGQRQLVCLARALLRRTKILILGNVQLTTIDVSGINEKCNIGIYYGNKDNFIAFSLAQIFISIIRSLLSGKRFSLLARRIYPFYHLTFIPETSNVPDLPDPIHVQKEYLQISKGEIIGKIVHHKHPFERILLARIVGKNGNMSDKQNCYSTQIDNIFYSLKKTGYGGTERTL